MDKKRVKDYMTYDVVTVGIHETGKGVIDKIQKTGHDGFPVVNDQKEVVGYISARDLLAVHPGTPVERIMSRHLIVADPEMSINDAARVIFLLWRNRGRSRRLLLPGNHSRIPGLPWWLPTNCGATTQGSCSYRTASPLSPSGS